MKVTGGSTECLLNRMYLGILRPLGSKDVSYPWLLACKATP